MPIGKRINKNKIKGDKGELLTQKFFNLKPTSGSGAGAYDKLDSKNDYLRVETKTTEKSEYVVDFDKFITWGLQAAQDRKQFFLHIIQEYDGSLDLESSVVACRRSLLIALSSPQDRQHWDQVHRYYPGKRVPVNFTMTLPYVTDRSEIVERVVEYHSEVLDSSFVTVRAPYFKKLLENNE